MWNKVEEITRVEVNYKAKNVYVLGHYNKYSRFMSQTPWFINGVLLVR